MADEAIRYLSAFEWCLGIHDKYFGDGFGGSRVRSSCFACSIRNLQQPPEWIWVIVGDLPPAYLKSEDFPSAKAALERYIEGVEDWVATPEDEERGYSRRPPPIVVPPGGEALEMLTSRMSTLRQSFLPSMKAE